MTRDIIVHSVLCLIYHDSLAPAYFNLIYLSWVSSWLSLENKNYILFEHFFPPLQNPACSRHIVCVVFIIAISLNKLYWIQGKTPTKQIFIHLSHVMLSWVYVWKITENPVSKYNATLIILIESPDFSLEEFFFFLY